MTNRVNIEISREQPVGWKSPLPWFGLVLLIAAALFLNFRSAIVEEALLNEVVQTGGALSNTILGISIAAAAYAFVLARRIFWVTIGIFLLTGALALEVWPKSALTSTVPI